jgi:hypothetical protein
MIKRMPRKARAKKPVKKRLHRNPVARALATRLFAEKAVARRNVYKRRPKHPAEPSEET